MPYIGKSPSFGVRNRFVYVADADDTSVSGADANGATLTFTDGAFVDVYLNGVLLKAGTDYVTTTANTIGSISAMAANDEVTVVVYDVFAVSDTVSATSGGTFSGGVNIDGAVTINESSADVDFRVESNGLTHALFVDGGNDSVLIGGSDVSVAVANEADNLIVGNNSDAITGITLSTSSGGYSSINFSDATSGDGRLAGYLAYDHNANQWVLGGKGIGTTLLHIHADGRFEQKGGVNSDNGPGLLVFNDGNNANRKGLGIQCGTDNASGTNIAAFFDSGNGSGQGTITFSGGTVTYGAFTAHHEISLPDDDKSKGYDYGTLLDIDQIYYAKNRDGTDQERGIRYLVKKSDSAYSKKVLGAYCGDMFEVADKDVYYTADDTLPSGKNVGDLLREAGTYKDNLHQAAILGDGHIICNGEKGNISVGDGITTSSTAGIGMKADKLCMVIGIAQEDITFSSASETKLVAVQYGIRQFTPWTD